ncbi:MAG: lysine--tRNA ligase [Acidobacteriia bacterium]|nr:lysine--tRNA ligase [Terriglobia bacterium]
MREAPTAPRHWADEAASAVASSGAIPVISTGISPSGEIHIGNMREVLTADAVYRALRDIGVAARFNYVCDNFDPLRKVYPFLDPATYASRVGQPLSDIPCPCGRHASYGDHFLEPFVAALGKLRVDVEIERADAMYKSGRMNPFIVAALLKRDRIAEILREMTGKEVAETWWPFNPLCPACGRIQSARVTGFSAERETVDYSCECSASGTVPMAGGGKLVWRIDWPARWKLLDVTVEPFGKDHATRGGSYETGVRIVREVFHGEPPFPIPYEWIRLKGGGDMSSSKGNVLAIGEALTLVPPEVLRYLVLRERPQRSIAFDPGLPLLQLVDEVDDATAAGRDERAIELSRAAGFRPVGIPFKHLVVVAQAAGFDLGRVTAILDRTGYPGLDPGAVAERMEYARRWLASYAPEDLRFEVRETLPAEALALSPSQRLFLGRLAEEIGKGMDGEAVHSLIYRIAGEIPEVRPAELFESIYISLLGKPRGPRAGWFVSLLGASFCARRFHEAAGGSR